MKHTDLYRYRHLRGICGFNGNYILEFSAVLVVLLPLLLGAVDINSALQGYTAAKVGSQTASRCLYPTDGECTVGGAFTPPTRLYDWYRGSQQDRYFVPHDSFSGTAYLLQGPAYSWNRYEAIAYASVSYDMSQRNYQLYQNTVTSSQNLTTVVELSSLPYVRGADPTQPTGFVYINEQGVRHGGELPSNIRVADVTDSQDGIIQITSPAWATNPTVGKILCAQSSEHDTVNASLNPAFGARCTAITQGSSPQYALAFWIAGEASGGNIGTTSGVSVEINYTLPDGSRASVGNGSGVELGGQVFSNPGIGARAVENFHPRGFKRSGIGDEMFNSIKGTASKAPEWATSSIFVPLNAKNLSLRLRSNGTFPNSLVYRITDIRVFAPEISESTFEASCSAATCSPTESCSLKYNGATFGEFKGAIPITQSISDKGDTKDAVLSNGLVSKSSNQVAKGEPQSFPNAALAAKALLTQSQSCGLSIEDIGAAETKHIEADPCPLDPKYQTLPGKSEDCSPPADIAVQNVNFNTTKITVPQNKAEEQAFDWKYFWLKSDCQDQYSESKFTPPSGLLRYDNFKAPSLTGVLSPTLTTDYIPTSPGSDPRTLLSSELKYNCGEYSVATVKYEGDSSSPSPDDTITRSLFSGAHPRFLNTPECLPRLLHDEAVRFGMPTYAYLEPAATFIEERETTIKPDSQCIPFRTQSILTNAIRIAEKLPDGSTPDDCPSHNCFSVYAGALIDSGKPPALDLVHARKLGEESLAALYPRAHFDCKKDSDDPDCAWINTSIIGDLVRIETTVNVPFNFLGRNTQQLTFGTSRKLEKSLLK